MCCYVVVDTRLLRCALRYITLDRPALDSSPRQYMYACKCVYMCIYIYVVHNTYMYMIIYIYIERERCISMYVCMYV